MGDSVFSNIFLVVDFMSGFSRCFSPAITTEFVVIRDSDAVSYDSYAGYGG